MSIATLTAMPANKPIKLQVRRKRVLLLAVAFFVLSALWFGFSLLRRPSWYRPPVVPVENQQKVRNNLVAAEQAFTQSLLAGSTFRYHIYQDDINKWLAMRKEIYPRVDELAPSTLRDPFVLIKPGKITLAGLLENSTLSGVVSLDFEISYVDDAIQIVASAFRCGTIRLPMKLDRLQLDRPIKMYESDAWPGSPPIEGSLMSGLRIERDGWWKNGGVDYRVVDLVALDGQIDLVIEPRGRHPRNK